MAFSYCLHFMQNQNHLNCLQGILHEINVLIYCFRLYTFWHKCFWDTYFEQSAWIHVNGLTSICKVFNLFQFLFKQKTQVSSFWEKIWLVWSSIKTCQIKWVLRKCRIISFKSYKNLPTFKDTYSEKKEKDLIDHSKVFFRV